MDLDRFKHYMIGIDAADAEHLVLLDQIGTILDHMEIEDAYQSVDKSIQLWRDHAVAEEKFMEAIKYPYFKAHVAEHAIRINMLEGMRDRIQHEMEYKGKRHFVGDTITILLTHIDHWDTQYALYYKQHPELHNIEWNNNASD